VDVGGTFTDVVIVKESTGEVFSHKVPTTPDNLLTGIFQGLSKGGHQLGRIVQELLGDCSSFVHGSTVCTNLVVQRSGTRLGLITTEGFRDALAIRRGIRKSIWDMKAPTPPDLVPRYLRCEVRERVDCFGNVLVPLDAESVDEALKTLESHSVEAIAICLFNAHSNGEHERAIRDEVVARFPDIPVLLSSEVHPVMGEYERVSSTALHAYVSPGAASYLDALDAELRANGLAVSPLIIQGNGGVIDIKRGIEKPGLLILSGPAAVSAAALRMGEDVGIPNLLVFDMGGTSCDVTVLLDGKITVTEGLEIGGYHFSAPSLDITTIGTGGGTIAHVDSGGMLRVGPRGAGAIPGPVCYQRGGQEPTVTDANLVLGRLGTDSLLGGEMPLDRAGAERIIQQKVAEPLSLTLTEAAFAILRIANQNMISAIEMLSVQKGRDPQDFTLVAAGGAGSLHASDLAETLRIDRVLIPRNAAVFSALGLLHADLRRDYVQSLIGDLETIPIDALKEDFRRLKEKAREEFLNMGLPAERVGIHPMIDLRYQGQNWDIPIPLSEIDITPETLQSVEDSFHDQHEILYGHRDLESVIEISNLRVTAVARTSPLASQVQEGPERKAVDRFDRYRDAFVDPSGPALSVPVISGETLHSGAWLTGPAIIEEPTTTVWVAPKDELNVDEFKNFLLLKKRN
jgi:N-methylhydantoinase A